MQCKKMGPRKQLMNTIFCDKFNPKPLICKQKQGIKPESDGFLCYSSIPKNYNCKFCELETSLKIFLYNHRNDFHTLQESSSASCKIVKCLNYKCENCNFQTFSILVLTRHEYSVHPAPESSHIDIDNDEWFRCEECTFKTLFSSSMQTHTFLKHRFTKEKFTCHSSLPDNYRCKYCKVMTNLKVNLFSHYSAFHPQPLDHKFWKVRYYQCKKCIFATYSALVLTKHEYSVHCITWFHCDYCPYRGKQKTYLKNHVTRYHSSQANVESKLSSSKTKGKTRLRKRNLIKHSVTWFQCEHCPYRCNRKNILKRHTLCHTASKDTLFQCEHCGFIFKCKRYLRKHMNMKHADGNAIKCKHCQYITKNNETLKLHIYVKHGDPEHINWFNCEQCSYKAKVSGYLKKHVRRMHPMQQGVDFKCPYQKESRTARSTD